MNQAASRQTPSRSAGVPQSETTVAEPASSTVAAEARHAAVCAGAIEYLPDLRGFARSLTGNNHQADDLVQGAILRALAAAQTFTPGTNFKAWSFTILRNAYYNHWRSPGSHHVMLDDSAAATATTEPTQDASLELCDFRRAFAQLGPNQREALILIGAAGLSYSEAAAVCNCAPGTMKSRVSRARALVKAILDGGPMNLRRRDVVPISAIDLAQALETSIAACNFPARTRRQRASATLREIDGDAAAAGSRPADLENAMFLLRS